MSKIVLSIGECELMVSRDVAMELFKDLGAIFVGEPVVGRGETVPSVEEVMRSLVKGQVELPPSTGT